MTEKLEPGLEQVEINKLELHQNQLDLTMPQSIRLELHNTILAVRIFYLFLLM